MLPLYLARIEDLGLGDFVKVDCAACPHVALLTPARSLGLGRLANPLVTDQSSELTLDDARKLYEKFADKDGGDAVRVMAQIALWGKRQQIEGGQLRLLALRQLGRFLIRNGRGQGRPQKTSSADV